jgi:hypothetical protein
MNKSQAGFLILGAWAFVQGCCGPSGAVFVEFTHYGLGVRSSPETASPVKVELGYEHGIVSFVPRRTSGPMAGEATSIIFSNNLSSKPLPGSGGEALKVDSIFVSGSAALALVAPQDSTVSMEAEGRKLETTVQEPPEKRLEAAFAPSARFTTVEQKSLNELLTKLNALPPAAQGTAIDKVATTLGDPFKKKIQDDTAAGQPKLQAFRRAVRDFLAAETTPGAGKNHQALIKALEDALK